jgi:transposase InsO family protein
MRALKVYEKHNQVTSNDFVDHVIDKFSFRIHTIQTDNGHEFQSKFHWHLLDHGINHLFIKRGRPQHNGKVEKFHRTDKREFYQLLDYKDDVDLSEKLNDCEQFYNLNRPHGSFQVKTPCEVLLSKMKN